MSKRTPNSRGPRSDLFTPSGRCWARKWSPRLIPKTPAYVNRALDGDEYDWSHQTGRVLDRNNPVQWAGRFAVHLATLGIFIRRARSKGRGNWRVWLPGRHCRVQSHACSRSADVRLGISRPMPVREEGRRTGPVQVVRE